MMNTKNNTDTSQSVPVDQKTADNITRALEKKEPYSYTVRTKETGDKVYMIKEGKRYWLRNPQTLEKLGFTMGAEETIPYSELNKFSEGESINLVDKKGTSEVRVSKKKANPVQVFKTPGVKPVLGYKEEATLEDFDQFNA